MKYENGYTFGASEPFDSPRMNAGGLLEVHPEPREGDGGEAVQDPTEAVFQFQLETVLTRAIGTGGYFLTSLLTGKHPGMGAKK